MATCYNRYYRNYYTCSTWYTWGRWVLLGAIILAALVFFFLLSCISQRRRRRAGRQPFYGTGWTYNLPGGKPAGYNPNQQYQPPPQPYNQSQYGQPQNTGGYTGSNNYNQGGGAAQSYFGGQRNDVEMQAPQNVYNGSTGYAPPAGPPPGKTNY